MSEKIIKVKKNCDNCISKSSCKFLDLYVELVRSNKFYSMFEYAEWNNLENLFKDNARKCAHYHCTFSDGKLELEKVGFNIFYKAIQDYLGSNLASTTNTNKTKEMTIKTKDNSIVTAEEIQELYTVELV